MINEWQFLKIAKKVFCFNYSLNKCITRIISEKSFNSIKYGRSNVWVIKSNILFFDHWAATVFATKNEFWWKIPFLLIVSWVDKAVDIESALIGLRKDDFYFYLNRTKNNINLSFLTLRTHFETNRIERIFWSMANTLKTFFHPV